MYNKKINYLKTRIYIFAFLYIAIIIVMVIACFYISGLLYKLNEKNEYLRSNIISMNAELIGLEKNIRYYNGAKELFSKLFISKKNMSHFETDKAIDLIKNLKKKYKISEEITVNMLVPIEVENIYKDDNKLLIYTAIDLDIIGITDELIFKFLDELAVSFPGFIRFKSLSMNKLYTENKNAVLEEIKNGNVPSLVETKVTFDWYDFKIIKESR